MAMKLKLNGICCFNKQAGIKQIRRIKYIWVLKFKMFGKSRKAEEEIANLKQKAHRP
jgi:hypothetical protein